MQKKILTLWWIGFILVYAPLTAQTTRPEAKDILNKIQNVYAQDEEYSLDMDYQLYQGATGTKLLNEYSGLLVRDHGNYYNRIKNTEFFYVGTKYLKVNHEQKRLQYGAVPKDLPIGVDISSYLKYFTKVSYTEDNERYVFTLETTEVTPFPYGKIEIFVHKKSLEIEKQVLYVLNEAPFKNEAGETVYSRPRLEFVISKKRKDIEKYAEKFDLSRYIKIKNNKAVGQGEIAGYQVLDTYR